MAKDSGSCEICGTRFSLMSWKRYCAKCKKSCCKECLTSRVAEGSKSDNVLICSDCVVAESTAQSIAIHEDLEITGEINRALRQELKEKVMALESFRTFLLELSTTFGPNSELFPNFGESATSGDTTPVGDDSPQDDRNSSVTDLITKCQADFDNMQNKIRLLRRQHDRLLISETKQKETIQKLNGKLSAITIERDELIEQVSKMNALIHQLDDQRQLYEEVSQERDSLRIRCEKLETLGNSGKHTHNISNALEDNETGRYNRGVQLFSFCCPRFYQ